MARVPSNVEKLLKDYEDVWYGNFSKLDVVSESIRISSPNLPNGEVRGREAFETYVRDFLTAFPDFHVTVDNILARETVVMIEWTATGTNEGEFIGNSPTERGFEIRGMSKILVEDGKVQEERLYYDFRELLEQLGITEE